MLSIPVMLDIPIKYLEEGKNELEVYCTPKELDLPLEFKSDIKIIGFIEKFGWQLNIKAEIKTELSLICDYTLEEFNENLSLNVNIICKLDNLSQEDKAIYTELDNFIFYKQDDNEIDIGEIIREDLLLNLPMKRVSPDYKDKNFAEIYPEFSAESIENQEDKPNPFAVLKNIKID